jgi:hypothetical protein
MLHARATTTFAVDLASAAKERDGYRDNIYGVSASPSIPESRSLAQISQDR